MSKANILLVEDDINLGFVIQDSLKMNGYNVHLETNGKDGLKAFNNEEYDLCVFDVMMPKKDGFSLAEDIRQLNADIPIFFLTAKTMTEDRIQGFKSGGDDYLTKPFSTEEFLLRVEALLRRTGKSEQHVNSYSIGKYTYDYANFTLNGPSGDKKLTKKEAEILKLLCQHKNQVIQRDVVLNMVWGDDSYYLGRSLDVFITKLRKYLGEDESVSITNIHGVGFKLEV